MIKVYRSLDQLPSFRNAVVTIGSFDGVHAGHLELLSQLKKISANNNGESVVVTFDPHPRLVLQPDHSNLQLLSTTEEKISLLNKAGIDHCVIVPFDEAFASQSPTQYIEDFLIKSLNPQVLVIGYDHKFGKARKGDVLLLNKYKDHFQVKEVAEQQIVDITVSSTKIRNALSEGNVSKANELLGYAYGFSGKVVKGQQLGRTIGFPTANIEPEDKHKLIPADGIYAVRARIDNEWLDAMMYIGNKPTLAEKHLRVIEVHLFDYDDDLYGKTIEVKVLKRTRDDKRFDKLEGLRIQLIEDKKEVQRALVDNKEIKAENVNASVVTVILNYNGIKYLEEFLPTLVSTTYENHRIVVADNASTDASVEFLTQEYNDRVEIIQLPENYGFAGGYNHALKHVSGTDYVVLLNSDVEVSPGWLEPLIEMMEENADMAACQPKILSQREPECFEHAGASGGWLDTLGYAFCRGRVIDKVEKDKGQYDQPQDCFWASGAAMVIRPELYSAIGGLDASFFAHYEEIDMCWRLKRAGYRIGVQPKSVVYHVGGGTLAYKSNRKKYLNFRNSLIALYKNSSFGKRIWVIPLRLILDGAAAVLFLSERDFGGINAILRAHLHFYRNFATIHERSKYEKSCVMNLSPYGLITSGGIYKGSIVWSFFAVGKRTFNEIVGKQ